MKDDDQIVTRPAAAPVRSDSPREPGVPGDRADSAAEFEEEAAGASGIEEAGYGYGV